MREFMLIQVEQNDIIRQLAELSDQMSAAMLSDVFGAGFGFSGRRPRSSEERLDSRVTELHRRFIENQQKLR